MSKVTVVGAGNVGATCANILAIKNVADEVVLLDIKEGVSEGKAMDMMQTAALLCMNSVIKGVTNDYAATEGSDMVVITSGIPRKPGMTREELIGVNAGIVKSVVENVLKYSPNAIILCVSNPMDTMTYLIHKATNLPKNRIIGMGGALDSSRFKYYMSQALGANANEVEGMVIGGHGDTTMIPLKRFATYKGVPVSGLLDAETFNKVAADTMVGGATLTKLLGTSAWMAPGAAASSVAESIIKNQGLQWMLADMQIQCTAARALLYRCVEQIEKTGQYDTQLGSITKTFVSDMCMKVTTDAVQIFGGYGYSREYPIEKLMRDAKIQQIFEGTNQIQRTVIAGQMAR